MMLDPVLKLAITMHSSKGVYVLLLGSGVSRSSAIRLAIVTHCDAF
jgi:hypothetical protein